MVLLLLDLITASLILYTCKALKLFLDDLIRYLTVVAFSSLVQLRFLFSLYLVNGDVLYILGNVLEINMQRESVDMYKCTLWIMSHLFLVFIHTKINSLKVGITIGSSSICLCDRLHQSMCDVDQGFKVKCGINGNGQWIWRWEKSTSLDRNLKRIQDFYPILEGKDMPFSPSTGIVKFNSNCNASLLKWNILENTYL